MGLKRYQLLALGGKLLEISGNSFAVCTVLVHCLLFFDLFFLKSSVINCISLQCQS